jgi:hypothetical protein
MAGFLVGFTAPFLDLLVDPGRTADLDGIGFDGGLKLGLGVGLTPCLVVDFEVGLAVGLALCEECRDLATIATASDSSYQPQLCSRSTLG